MSAKPAVLWDYGCDDPPYYYGGHPTFGILRTELVGDRIVAHENAVEVFTSNEDRCAILEYLNELEWARFRRERRKSISFCRAAGIAAAVKYLDKIGQSKHVTVEDRVRAGEAE